MSRVADTEAAAIAYSILTAADGVVALVAYVILTDYLWGKNAKEPPGVSIQDGFPIKLDVAG